MLQTERQHFISTAPLKVVLVVAAVAVAAAVVGVAAQSGTPAARTVQQPAAPAFIGTGTDAQGAPASETSGTYGTADYGGTMPGIPGVNVQLNPADRGVPAGTGVGRAPAGDTYGGAVPRRGPVPQ